MTHFHLLFQSVKRPSGYVSWVWNSLCWFLEVAWRTTFLVLGNCRYKKQGKKLRQWTYLRVWFLQDPHSSVVLAENVGYHCKNRRHSIDAGERSSTNHATTVANTSMLTVISSWAGLMPFDMPLAKNLWKSTRKPISPDLRPSPLLHLSILLVSLPNSID